MVSLYKLFISEKLIYEGDNLEVYDCQREVLIKYRITAYILFCIMSTSTVYLKSLDYYMIDWLICWLIDYCWTSSEQHCIYIQNKNKFNNRNYIEMREGMGHQGNDFGLQKYGEVGSDEIFSLS